MLGYKEKTIYLGIVLLVSLGFLFSPKPQEKLCSSYVAINEHLGFIINCDSHGFLDAAENPSMLLKRDFFWQSRPLYIFTGSVIGYLLFPIINSIPPKYFQISVVSNFPPINAPEAAKIHIVSFYLAFLIINIGLLFLSVILLDRIMELISDSEFPQVLKYIFSIFVVSNLVTKAFVFSPHLQMMTMVCPLLCCYLALTIVLKTDLPFKKLILISFLVGFLNLLYGSSLLILPSMIFAFLYRKAKHSDLRINCAKEVILLTVAFVTPLLIWVAVVFSKNGNYFNPEVSVYRQFIWIFDTLSQGIQVFAYRLKIYTINYLLTMKILIVPIGIFVTLRIINLRKKSGENEEIIDKSAKRRVLLSIFILYFIFIWLINFTTIRLTYNLFFVSLCLIVLEAAILNNRHKFLRKRFILFTLAILAIFLAIYNIISYGPFE